MTAPTPERPERAQSKYSGADWIKTAFKNKVMSHFGEQVADLLGNMFLGIYHLNYSSLSKVEWDNPNHIEVNVYGGMGTYDDDKLTRLVLLAHDMCVRVEIQPNMKYLKLVFHPRQRDGGISIGHPTLEKHIAGLRKHYEQVLA